MREDYLGGGGDGRSVDSPTLIGNGEFNVEPNKELTCQTLHKSLLQADKKRRLQGTKTVVISS